jgi:hypothetical protein
MFGKTKFYQLPKQNTAANSADAPEGRLGPAISPQDAQVPSKITPVQLKVSQVPSQISPVAADAQAVGPDFPRAGAASEVPPQFSDVRAQFPAVITDLPPIIPQLADIPPDFPPIPRQIASVRRLGVCTLNAEHNHTAQQEPGNNHFASHGILLFLSILTCINTREGGKFRFAPAQNFPAPRNFFCGSVFNQLG